MAGKGWVKDGEQDEERKVWRANPFEESPPQCDPALSCGGVGVEVKETRGSGKSQRRATEDGGRRDGDGPAAHAKCSGLIWRPRIVAHTTARSLRFAGRIFTPLSTVGASSSATSMKQPEMPSFALPVTNGGHHATSNGHSLLKDPAFPKYDQLPEGVPGFPCSWDYFNSLVKEGHTGEQRDQCGTLNFLTPSRIAAAKAEIMLGKVVSLNAPYDQLAGDMSAFGGRAAPSHTIQSGMPNGREDSLNFNTQVSSHWDGFRHFGFFGRAVQFYQGYTPEDLASSNVLGIHSWSERGGIVGRGVLVDFYSWATSRGEDPGVNTGRAITLGDVISVLNHQGTTIKAGDILIFRTGWMKWYRATAPDLRHQNLCIEHAPGAHAFVGLEASREFIEWLWNNQISAVAGDQPAFEVTPPPPPQTTGWLHEHLLAALGCPMGELWELEALASECAKLVRFTFFFSSMPLHVLGGVASPINATAIL